MKTVRFKHGMSPYQNGEVASFEDDYADKIIAMGYAEIFKEPKAEPKTQAKAKAKEEPDVNKMVSGAKTKKKK